MDDTEKVYRSLDEALTKVCDVIAVMRISKAVFPTITMQSAVVIRISLAREMERLEGLSS